VVIAGALAYLRIKAKSYSPEGNVDFSNDKVKIHVFYNRPYKKGRAIFGKLVPGMVMDTVGPNVNNSYHQLSNWGMDILHVGNSLGAGAIAFGIKENGKDTLSVWGDQTLPKKRISKLRMARCVPFFALPITGCLLVNLYRLLMKQASGADNIFMKVK